METLERTHNMLVAARNYLAQTGWIQGSFIRPEGVCVIGALRCVGLSSVHGQGSLDVLNSLVKDLPDYPARWRDIEVAYYNDRVATCKEDVLELYDIAIELTAPEPAIPELELPKEDYANEQLGNGLQDLSVC